MTRGTVRQGSFEQQYRDRLGDVDRELVGLAKALQKHDETLTRNAFGDVNYRHVAALDDVAKALRAARRRLDATRDL
jgi:hypothetical protein